MAITNSDVAKMAVIGLGASRKDIKIISLSLSGKTPYMISNILSYSEKKVKEVLALYQPHVDRTKIKLIEFIKMDIGLGYSPLPFLEEE